ncbi:MAG: ASCH domain-containing protein [Acidimicrobiales bacterium]
MAFSIVDGQRTLEIGTPGAMRQRLNQLVLDGHKRATAGLLLDYVREDVEVESEGELLSLVDDESRRVATVRVVDVATVPFVEVPWAFAQAEAEGDESLEEWREGHRRFWAEGGDVVDDHTPIVLLRFEVVSP